MIDLNFTDRGDLSQLLADASALANARGPSRTRRLESARRFKRVENAILKDLRQTPPPRNRGRKFVWSRDPEKNANARRWFFQHFPNGYRRTGTLAKQWRVLILFGREGISVTITNESNAASFVYGNERFPQVPGHQATGWPHALDLLVSAQSKAEDAVEREIDLLLEGR